jgi:hypothetical protein
MPPAQVAGACAVDQDTLAAQDSHPRNIRAPHRRPVTPPASDLSDRFVPVNHCRAVTEGCRKPRGVRVIASRYPGRVRLAVIASIAGHGTLHPAVGRAMTLSLPFRPERLPATARAKFLSPIHSKNSDGGNEGCAPIGRGTHPGHCRAG